VGLGGFLKGSVRRIAFYPRYRRGKRYRPLRVGYKVRGLITQTRHVGCFYDGSRVWALQNAVVLLRKKSVLKTKHNSGLLLRLVNRNKYQAMFDHYL
jgi:hypothetical protein